MEKKAIASEKTKALAEKRLADLEAKVRETKLKLAEVESLNTAWAEELADLRAALEGCESKWYNEGFADAENSVELVINEARKLALKDGWFATLQAAVVLEDSPLKTQTRSRFLTFLLSPRRPPLLLIRRRQLD